MEPAPDSLVALLAIVAVSSLAVTVAIARLVRSGRTVPPPWGRPPGYRRRR
jgi:hypothetical protein